MDSLEVGSTQGLKAPTTFPIQRFPMELQLLILRYILVSPIPILNAGVAQNVQVLVIEGEEKGQYRINPNMIFTCKLFYKEGLPLLYGYNTFTYTRESQIRMYVLHKCSFYLCPRCGKSYTNRHAESGYPCFGNVALANHTTSLNLRFPSSWVIYKCVEVVCHVTRFTSLKTSHLDHLDSGGDQSNHRLVDQHVLRGFQEIIEETAKNLQDPCRSNGALRVIVLTGLPRLDICLDVVKQYARLLAPDGRLGIGWGSKGKQYEFRKIYVGGDDGEVVKRKDLELLWMTAGEVEAGALDRLETSDDE